MVTFSSIVLILCGIVAVGCLWFLYCNHVTYKQRMDIISATWADYRTEYDVLPFDTVSYQEHLWANVLFKNPWALYNNHELIENAKAGKRPYWESEDWQKRIHTLW